MAALYGFRGPPDPTLLKKMGNVLGHRGPGAPQTFERPHASLGYRADDRRVNPGSGITQLRITQLGNTQQDHTIIACAGMLTSGHTLDDLCRLWNERGVDLTDPIRGSFIIAVITPRRTHIFRDHAGCRSVFWAEHAAGGVARTMFAIEPKAILAAPGFSRTPRPAAIAQFLAFSFVPLSGTMLEGVHDLPAGCRLDVDDDGTRVHRYFKPELLEQTTDPHPGPHSDPHTHTETGTETDTNRSDQDWIDHTRSIVHNAIDELRPAGAEPSQQPSPHIAASLSGGLDSTIIATAIRQRHDPASQGLVHTYAIHFGPKLPNELSFARMAADRAGAEHHEVLIRPKDTLPRLRQMIWHLDDAIGDPITMPNYELAARIASDGYHELFNGEGGDPVFGGPKNIPMMLQHAYGGIDRPADFRERAYLASYRRAYQEIQRLLSPEMLRQIDHDRDLVSVLTPFLSPPEQPSHTTDNPFAPSDSSAQPTSFLNKLMLINIRLKGAHLILPKVERLLGAHGIVPLSPLFDPRLIEASFAMPPRMKLRTGIEKWALKRAFETDIPQEIIDRPKSGMRVPVNYWFRGELKRYARSILNKKNVRAAGWFNEHRVNQILKYDTEEGPGRYGIRLWMLITLELYRRIVIEGETL